MELLLAIILLFAGSEALVLGASSFATRLKISPLIIGLTILAFSTSSPELFVSVQASLQGSGDIAVGNIVGSNIFATAIGLGLCALVCPIALKRQLFTLDLPVMFGSYALLALVIYAGGISRIGGLFFIAALVAYTWVIYRIHKKNRPTFEAEEVKLVGGRFKSIYFDLGLIVVGLAVLLYGSELFLGRAEELARAWGVSDATIGLTIVAIGTSLPEIACSIAALRHKKFDILAGNIIGSNTFNVLCVIGASALAKPITVRGIEVLDVALMFAVGLLLYPIAQKRLELGRLKGLVLTALYIVYLCYNISL